MTTQELHDQLELVKLNLEYAYEANAPEADIEDLESLEQELIDRISFVESGGF